MADNHNLLTELESKGFITIHEEPSLQFSNTSRPNAAPASPFLRQLQDEVNAFWDNRHGSRYTSTRVLLVHWDGDDLGVLQEVDVLEHVFSSLYHYDVKKYMIPNSQPDRLLKQRVIDFLKADKQDTLLIFYYAGHAFIIPDRHDIAWTAHRSPYSPSLLSSGIQTLLEEAECDVLLLYDTCHSVATKSIRNKITGGVKEVLAACGFDGVAAEVGEHSFTNALVQELIIASDERQISIAQFHNRLVARLKPRPPSPMKDINGHLVRGPQGKLVYEKNRRRTPIYSVLDYGRSRRNIFLSPMRNSPLRENATVPRQIVLKIAGLATRRKRASKPRNSSSICVWPDPTFDASPDFVIGVKLVEATVDSQHFQDDLLEWSRAAPKRIQYLQFGYSSSGYQQDPPDKPLVSIVPSSTEITHQSQIRSTIPIEFPLDKCSNLRFRVMSVLCGLCLLVSVVVGLIPSSFWICLSIILNGLFLCLFQQWIIPSDSIRVSTRRQTTVSMIQDGDRATTLAVWDSEEYRYDKQQDTDTDLLLKVIISILVCFALWAIFLGAIFVPASQPLLELDLEPPLPEVEQRFFVPYDPDPAQTTLSRILGDKVVTVVTSIDLSRPIPDWVWMKLWLDALNHIPYVS